MSLPSLDPARATHCVLASLLVLAPTACGDDSEPDEAGSSSTAGVSTGPAAGTMDASGSTAAADSTGLASTGDDASADSSGGGAMYDCSSFSEGTVNGFMVEGMSREFILNLPSGVEDGGPWPVVFNWHGLGDSAQNMSGLVAPHVDNEVMPFIAVTPEDTNFMLDIAIPGLPSMDWEVFAVDPAINREIALFDAVLACLDERYGVDPEHVHSMGFSLGGIVTDMLASHRSDVLASVATYSGGYWNNPQNVTPLLGTAVMWPEYTADQGYTQLFLHGDTTDLFDLSLIQLQFDEYAEADSTFLRERGHDTIVCNHGGGHTVPTSTMGADRLIEFFAEHPYGTVDSPYAAGLPGSFPEYCEFRAKTTE